jgi:hypothetical protein
MAAMSDYLEDQIINHIFRSSTFSKPATIAIALCTAAPTAASTGSTIVEVANSGSYARVNLGAPNDSTWGDPSVGDGTTGNTGTITFPQATANWNATVTYVAIVDSATYGAGNVLFWGALATPKTVTTGDTFQFDVDSLEITIDS